MDELTSKDSRTRYRLSRFVCINSTRFQVASLPEIEVEMINEHDSSHDNWYDQDVNVMIVVKTMRNILW